MITVCDISRSRIIDKLHYKLNSNGGDGPGGSTRFLTNLKISGRFII